MDLDKKNEKKFDPLNENVKEYIKFLSEEEGLDYEDFLNKYQEAPFFIEFNQLIKQDKNSENKAEFENKIRAFEYRMKYKYTKYKIPICAEEDYNLFITNLENLITYGLIKEPEKTLELIYNFIIKIIPTINKDRRRPSDITVGALTKDKFEEWVKDRIVKLKGQPIENIKFLIKKELMNFNLPFWEEQKNLKKKMMSDKKVLEKDVETIVYSIEGYYEAFRLICGMLIGLFDIIEGNYDDNLERSYYGDKFNTDFGFYSSCKKQEGNSLKNDTRPTLKKYFKKYGCLGFKDYFNWLINSVKPIRLTGAHHQALIEQDKILEGRYKVKYKDGIKDTPIGFLDACNIGVSSFITLTFWVAFYFLLNNI